MSEAGARVITCTNKDGQYIRITERGFEPYILVSAEGIYDIDNTISTASNTVIDGSEYQGSTMNQRNIVLTIKEIDNFVNNRETIDLIFTRGEIGTLNVVDDEHDRSIEYYVENVTTTANFDVRYTTISLICPDPFFYDRKDTNVGIGELVSDFEFIHEFSEDKEPIGHYSTSGLGIIRNTTSEKNIGFSMVIQALGDVKNMTVTKVETQEFIKIGSSSKPLQMHYGDILTIVTKTGKKNIYLNNVPINQYLSEDSTFFQITRGVNSIGCEADEGEDYYMVNILYRYKYMRA